MSVENDPTFWKEAYERSQKEYFEMCSRYNLVQAKLHEKQVTEAANAIVGALAGIEEYICIEAMKGLINSARFNRNLACSTASAYVPPEMEALAQASMGPDESDDPPWEEG